MNYRKYNPKCSIHEYLICDEVQTKPRKENIGLGDISIRLLYEPIQIGDTVYVFELWSEEEQYPAERQLKYRIYNLADKSLVHQHVPYLDIDKVAKSLSIDKAKVV